MRLCEVDAMAGQNTSNNEKSLVQGNATAPPMPGGRVTKTLTFGLGNPFGWDTRKKALVDCTQEQRKAIYNGLRATSRILGQAINIQNAREYIRRIMKIPDELVAKFKPSNTSIRRELEELGLAVENISGATLSQTYALGVKPDFAGEHGKSLLRTGNRQLPTHRTDGTHPILGRARETLILHLQDQYFLVVQVFSEAWAKKYNLPSGWIAFPAKIKPRDKTMSRQFDRTIQGEWVLKNSRICRNPRKRGNRWLGQVVVSYVPEPYKQLDAETIMGVDLGVNVPACVHIRDHGKPMQWAMKIGRGRDMLNTRGLIRSDIVRIIRALRSKDSPLDSEARRVAQAKLKQLRKRERRVMKTASQTIAARIAEVARRNGAGCWQMEDLSPDIKDDKPWLARNWAPGMVVDAVRWQAQQLGAKLEFIPPKHTSQRCSKCGHISAANRPKGRKGAAYFQCVKCSYADDADKNAARNISTPGIADLIQVNSQKSPNGEVR